MTRVPAAKPRQPADKLLGAVLARRLREAKALAAATLEPALVEHEGHEIALVGVEHDFEREVSTVFVRLTALGRQLLPIPWAAP